MAYPFIGEIRIFAGNFAPVNWALCNGAQLPISSYNQLFALIGTTYGGDGQTNFNLPNLQGRLAVGMGQGLGLSPYALGQAGGTETVTLTTEQLPSHNHPLMATTTGATLATPGGNLTGAATSGIMYTSTGSPAPSMSNLNGGSCSNTGANLPHNNMMPYQCLTFIIALYGVYPTQS